MVAKSGKNDSYELLQERVEQLFEEGREEDAIGLCDAFISKNPKSVEGFIIRQNLYGDMERIQEALEDSKMIIKLGHKEPIAYLQKGILELCLGNYKSALKDLNKVQKMTQNYNAEVLYNKGVANLSLGYVDRAVSSLEKMIELGYHDYAPLVLLYNISRLTGDTSKALKYYDYLEEYKSDFVKIKKKEGVKAIFTGINGDVGSDVDN